MYVSGKKKSCISIVKGTYKKIRKRKCNVRWKEYLTIVFAMRFKSVAKQKKSDSKI